LAYTEQKHLQSLSTQSSTQQWTWTHTVSSHTRN
jgi:hypothetical protein